MTLVPRSEGVDLTRVALRAVREDALRHGGRPLFNVGGGFAGVRHPEDQVLRTKPSLTTLIHHIAARDHGYTPPPAPETDEPKLPLTTITRHLAGAGLSVVDTEVTAHHSTMAEKKAWLSIPAFARPADPFFTYAQKMHILDAACALTTPDTPVVTSWLVVVAQRPETTG
ncbi:hypothetical protein [Streptomyces mobaraensis]|uniref:Uncharacterized protein n=1 Tax=Streptomyces mobaraensis TaxID=35621 RepID=A0A5N5W1X7_STRMB|nr:hypothetical protein [Streptomyces mobaraensis]KAB7835770.1 hypothetical protein FRZ00_26500 [Streptomyces mobaraensis]